MPYFRFTFDLLRICQHFRQQVTVILPDCYLIMLIFITEHFLQLECGDLDEEAQGYQGSVIIFTFYFNHFFNYLLRLDFKLEVVYVAKKTMVKDAVQEPLNFRSFSLFFNAINLQYGDYAYNLINYADFIIISFVLLVIFSRDSITKYYRY